MAGKNLFVVIVDESLSGRISYSQGRKILRVIAKDQEGAAASVAPSLEGRVTEEKSVGPVKVFKVTEGSYEGSQIAVIDPEECFS